MRRQHDATRDVLCSHGYETENDDNLLGASKVAMIPESLDGGDLGIQRKLYCRELIARFAHNLALNWNLGEENTQFAKW